MAGMAFRVARRDGPRGHDGGRCWVSLGRLLRAWKVEGLRVGRCKVLLADEFVLDGFAWKGYARVYAVFV